MKKISVLLSGLLLIVSGCGQGTGADGDVIEIAGKSFTEQILLTHIMEIALEEQTDLEIHANPDTGATDVLHPAIQQADIDIYPEYTGTAYMIVMGEELDTTDPEVIYNRVQEYYNQEFDITWLDPYQFNNTYAIAVRKETAQELGVETVSDLVEHASDMTLGSDFDFLERADGIKNFNAEYGIDEWGQNVGMDPGLMYTAIKEGEVDAIVAYATDGRIPRYDLVLLEDDQQFFPPYFAAPIIRGEVLEAHPEIAEVLNQVSPHLTMEKMAELNSKVDIDGELESNVAREFLIEIGLIAG